MIEVEIDGKKVSVADGSMVMHAAEVAGIYVPHFCYHKKLTIAANCRMCLVDVEKMPKAMPACATPATNGMVVRTKSAKATKAQRSVMEFLLINHPLDCPICDQGGECQLQDLAVGYGASASRYSEEKRVVLRKDVGPLVSMEEMTRCIHCTRCVRFGKEIAGVMELGMIHRGELSEITTVHGRTIDSELSGNMIDICPVGALTSKPFRYSARTWELARRKSVSPHDSTGANLVVQVKSGTVMRVVPLENEEVNECWIADRDRFSYEALSGAERLGRPMIKRDGAWAEVDWKTALDTIAAGLKQVRTDFGGAEIGAVGHVSSTVEELHLLAKLVRALGSESVDHRTRHADFANVAPPGHARWLGMPIAGLAHLDRALVVGSFLRKDHPLLAQRIRQSARRGALIHSVHAVDDDWLLPVAERVTAAPSGWVRALADIAAAVAAARGIAAPVEASVTVQGQRIASSLLLGARKAVLLGNAAAQHPEASALLALAQWIADRSGASFGYLGEGANSVGAQLVRALPGPGGFDAGRMLARPMKALLLLNTEPVLDSADPAATRAALAGSGLVVALTAFADLDRGVADVADVLLPIAPFTETAGTFVNAEGRVQSFHGVVPPLGEARPAWKVLRVLGNLLDLPGFDFETAEDVRAEALGDRASLAQRLDNRAATPPSLAPARPPSETGYERVADVPIYATDPIVRRAESLQRTADARDPVVGLPPALWQRLGLRAGDTVRVAQGAAAAVLPARADATLAATAVRIAAGHPTTSSLGPMFGPIAVERPAP
jgi:NADH-quinone oxidoreductase subunit G